MSNLGWMLFAATGWIVAFYYRVECKAKTSALEQSRRLLFKATGLKE